VYKYLQTSGLIHIESSTMISVEGWHSRGLKTPYPDPDSFSATAEALILTVLLNAQVETQGITLALFTEEDRTVAIDALGRVFFAEPDDVKGILLLAERALALPKTGTFRNTWIIKHAATCQQNHRIFIPPKDKVSTARSLGDLKEITVQGFSKTTKELRDPVKEYRDLPDDLFKLMGLLLEAREGAGPGKERNEDVLEDLGYVLNPLF